MRTAFGKKVALQREPSLSDRDRAIMYNYLDCTQMTNSALLTQRLCNNCMCAFINSLFNLAFRLILRPTYRRRL